MSEEGKSEEEFQIRDMNLVQMARQLHFLYRNLAGYQMELRDKQSEVDEEICDIMHFVELYQREAEQKEKNIAQEEAVSIQEVSYNVTQGYKMFKQLKGLHLQRKEKLTELNRVQAIMGCFDCGAMADTYRYLEGILSGQIEQDAVMETVDSSNDELSEEMPEAILKEVSEYRMPGDMRDGIVAMESNNLEDVRAAI